MPKSQVRKKKVYTPPTDIRPAAAADSKKPSPIWLPISAVTLIVVGIAWLVVYYLSSQEYPVPLALASDCPLRAGNVTFARSTRSLIESASRAPRAGCAFA